MGQVRAMAVTTGVTIANVYYCQPILTEIATSLNVSTAQVGYLPVLTQAGVGIGLFFLAPLGDMIDRKRIVVALEMLLVLALAGMSLASSLSTIYVLSFAIGVLAVSVQIVVPMAASISTPQNRGKIVGTVFTGTLIGILASRIASGYISEWLGWRWVYGISAMLALAVAGLAAWSFPSQVGKHTGGYGTLMKSTLFQIVRFRKLRRLALLGALVFGLFCSFWTTLTFHLNGAPFDYSSSQIGLFGFVAIAGALVTPVFGRLADRTVPESTQMITVAIPGLGVVAVILWPASLTAFIAAALLIDVGVQATQVNNLAQIYSLDEHAHSRINTIFMTVFFLGGSVGTWCGVLAWGHGGWPLATAQLAVWAVAAFICSIWNYQSKGAS
jgi:predicted MFS family arabinose efflux permease